MPQNFSEFFQQLRVWSPHNQTIIFMVAVQMAVLKSYAIKLSMITERCCSSVKNLCTTHSDVSSEFCFCAISNWPL